MTNNATGDKYKQIGLIKYVAIINTTQLIITNLKALLAEIIPLGISLMAVRGFLASKLLSKYLLKAIAAERAVIMQTITNINFKPYSLLEIS